MFRARPTSVRLARLPVLLLATVLALVLAVALQPARPAYAAPAFVRNLGAASGTTTPLQLVTTAPAQAGDSIIIAVSATAASAGDIQCSDPVNGAYTLDVRNSFFGIVGICSKHAITTLPAGSVITISSPGWDG
jgi:hypothetical protein